jgi:hypothetical protein
MRLIGNILDSLIPTLRKRRMSLASAITIADQRSMKIFKTKRMVQLRNLIALRNFSMLPSK